MLPATGFFKDIDCPYHESSCGRPYCHFRHRKRNQESSEDSQDGVEQKHAVPTYNPTPKSQLQSARSHIPVSYVPNIVVRTERSIRNPPSYNFGDKVTYKPTPLSELSKNSKQSNAAIEESIYLPESVHTNLQINDQEDLQYGCDSQNINFEDLSTEFDMIDDIINEENKQSVQLDQQKTSNNLKSREKNISSVKDDHKSHRSKSSSREKYNSKDRSKSEKVKDHKHNEKNDKEKKRSFSKDNEKNSVKDSHCSKTTSSKSKDISSKSSSKHKESDKNYKDKHRNKERSNKDDKHRIKDERKVRDKHYEKDGHRERDKHKSKHKEKSTSSKEKRTTAKEKEKKYVPNIEEKNNVSENEDSNDHYLIDFDEDLNDPSLEEECYKIFNEYRPEPIYSINTLHKGTEVVEEYVPTPKKRIAHQGAEKYVSKVPEGPQRPAQNPALAMLNRFKAAKEAHASNEQNNIISEMKGIKRPQGENSDKNFKKPKLQLSEKLPSKEQSKKETSKALSLVDDIINGSPSTAPYIPTKVPTEFLMKSKTRIAPVQNVVYLQQAKAKIAEMAKRNVITNKTPMQTIGKGAKRVAHIPDMSLNELPDALQPENKKIPLNVRTRYLTLIAEECLKLYLLKQDAYERALNEELKVLEKCATVITYRNSAMLAINRIRKEVAERESKGLGPISSDEVTHSDKNSLFRGKTFYENILVYKLTEDELELHGYPREGPVPGKAVLKNQKQLPKVNLNANQRLCCRCYKVYTVDELGIPSYSEECIYHPLKKRTIRGDRVYLCCKSTEDTGCMTAATHVCETEAELEGYQTTMDPERDDDPRNYAVYALDCEMCYTTKGLELTRVTIVDSDCKTVYESLVKPLNPIVDYNTQFSGITKDQMDRTSTSILQVQANILHLCNSKTILIGHSLESDMKALKIIHSCVIDTSILFPHRLGLPHKKALRVLASEFLKKIIQSDVNGHDSAEDALSCMELVTWKLKEDLKTRSGKI